MKILAMFAALLALSVPVTAQNNFGNDEDLRAHTIYPGVRYIDSLLFNYETTPIEFDPLTVTYVSLVESKTAKYRSGEVVYYPSTGTRVVVVENYQQRVKYLDGSVGTSILKKAIFLILPDELSVIEILVEERRYRTHFNREPRPLGSMYDARTDPKILGIDQNIDQKSLGQLLRQYLPHGQLEDGGTEEAVKKKIPPHK